MIHLQAGLLLTLTAIFFSSSFAEAACPNPTPFAVKIGALVSGSGDDSQRVLNAIRLAIYQISSAGSNSNYTIGTDTISFVGSANDGCLAGTATTTADGAATSLAQAGANIIIGPSCSEGAAAAQSVLTLRKVPLLTYASLDSTMSSSSDYSYFLRVSTPNLQGPTALLDLLSALDLVQFGLLCADNFYFTSFCRDASALAARRGMDAHVFDQLATISPSSSSATAARLEAAINGFQTRAVKVIAVMAPLELTRVIASALFERGMFGSNFVYIVHQQVQTPALTSDPAGYSVFTNAIVLQGATQRLPLTSEVQFLADYAANFTSDTSPGFFAKFAYDSVMLVKEALQSLRFAKCEVNMTTVKLMNEMRVTEFNGASGRVAFGGSPKGAVGVENNRHIAPTLYRLNNLVGSWSQKFIQVGAMDSGALTIDTPVTYPGGFTSPPVQYRVGLLYTDPDLALAASASFRANVIQNITTASTAAAAALGVTGGWSVVSNANASLSLAALATPTAVLGAQLAAALVSSGVSALNLASQGQSTLFSSDAAMLGGRDSIVLLPSQTRADDCAQSTRHFDAVREILGNRSVAAIVGSPCGIVVSQLQTSVDPINPTDTTFPSSIPMISYAALEQELSNPNKYPFFLRTNLPIRNQTSALLSLIGTYGWTRLGLVYSTSQASMAALATMDALLPLYGCRDEARVFFNSSFLSFSTESLARAVIDPLQRGQIRVVFLLLDANSNTQPFYLRFLAAAQHRNYFGANVQFVALDFFGATLSSVGFLPPLSTQVARNLIFPQAPTPNSASYQLFLQRWLSSNLTKSSTSTPPLSAAYAFDAIQLIAAALKSLKASKLAYSPPAFIQSLRSATLSSAVAATGEISFPSTANILANDRLAQENTWEMISIQVANPISSTPTGTIVQTLGSIDKASAYIPSANPLSWGGGAAVPPVSCPPGSVGTLSLKGSIQVSQCNPCPNNSYAPDYASSCLPCTDSNSQFCFFGASVPVNKTLALLKSYKQVFPISEGSLTDVKELDDFNLASIYVIGVTIAGFIVYGVLLWKCLPRKQQFKHIEFWKQYDIYYNDHPTELGKPVIKKNTAIGGFFSCSLLIFTILIGAYLLALYVIDRFKVEFSMEVGTALIEDGSSPFPPFRFDLSFILTDNLVLCSRLCEQTASPLPGKLTCDTDAQLALCNLRFKSDNSNSMLPASFSFDINYPNARVHGIYIYVSSLDWLGRQFGYNTTVQARNGTVFFGLDPMVFNITMQPFRWDADSSVSATRAPRIAIGYVPLLASSKNASMMGELAWRSNDLLALGAGVRVQLNFLRPQQVARFQTKPKTAPMEFITIFCCIIFTGLNFLVSGFRYVIEWYFFDKRRTRDAAIAAELNRRTEAIESLSKLRDKLSAQNFVPSKLTAEDLGVTPKSANQSKKDGSTPAAVPADSNNTNPSSSSPEEKDSNQSDGKKAEGGDAQNQSTLDAESREKDQKEAKEIASTLLRQPSLIANEVPPQRMLGLFLEQTPPETAMQAIIVNVFKNGGESFNYILLQMLRLLHRYYIDHNLKFPYTWIEPAAPFWTLKSTLANSALGQRNSTPQGEFLPRSLQQVREFEREQRERRLAATQVMREQRARERAVEDEKRRRWLGDEKPALEAARKQADAQAEWEVQESMRLAVSGKPLPGSSRKPVVLNAEQDQKEADADENTPDSFSASSIELEPLEKPNSRMPTVIRQQPTSAALPPKSASRAASRVPQPLGSDAPPPPPPQSSSSSSSSMPITASGRGAPPPLFPGLPPPETFASARSMNNNMMTANSSRSMMATMPSSQQIQPQPLLPQPADGMQLDSNPLFNGNSMMMMNSMSSMSGFGMMDPNMSMGGGLNDNSMLLMMQQQQQQQQMSSLNGMILSDPSMSLNVMPIMPNTMLPTSFSSLGYQSELTQPSPLMTNPMLNGNNGGFGYSMMNSPLSASASPPLGYDQLASPLNNGSQFFPITQPTFSALPPLPPANMNALSPQQPSFTNSTVPTSTMNGPLNSTRLTARLPSISQTHQQQPSSYLAASSMLMNNNLNSQLPPPTNVNEWNSNPLFNRK